MNIKLLGIIVIVLGALALAYGGFTYVKSTDTTKIGPVELSVQNKETVNIPIWAGVGAVIAGGALLLFSGKRAGS